jgi:hypothetical protein
MSSTSIVSEASSSHYSDSSGLQIPPVADTPPSYEENDGNTEIFASEGFPSDKPSLPPRRRPVPALPAASASTEKPAEEAPAIEGEKKELL